MGTDVDLRDGDLIFQTSKSPQSKALQLATNSKYSHCGIVYKKGDDFLVYEAVRPVSSASLNEWINRGEGGHYTVRRLINADEVLSTQTLEKMKEKGEEFNGRPYDDKFKWDNDSLYCSELIWKIYNEAAGIEIGKTQQLKDLDQSSEEVKKLMEERYQGKIPNEETIISPRAIFESDLLMTVEDTYGN